MAAPKFPRAVSGTKEAELAESSTRLRRAAPQPGASLETEADIQASLAAAFSDLDNLERGSSSKLVTRGSGARRLPRGMPPLPQQPLPKRPPPLPVALARVLPPLPTAPAAAVAVPVITAPLVAVAVTAAPLVGAPIVPAPAIAASPIAVVPTQVARKRRWPLALLATLTLTLVGVDVWRLVAPAHPSLRALVQAVSRAASRARPPSLD